MGWLTNKLGASSKHAAQVADLEGQLEALQRANAGLNERISTLQETVDHQAATSKEQSHQHRTLATKYDQVVSTLHIETANRYQQQRDTLLAEERAVQAERALCLQSGTDIATFASERELNSQLSKLKQPFVLILIDGDAYFFQDKYVSAGKVGGANLAQDIANEVTRLIESRPNIPPHCAIVVRMFMNKSNACSTTTQRLGEQLMRPFDSCLTNASQTLSLFDIIDCGTGKERVDSKIHANFHLYVKNLDCHAIVLAACSDNGFVRLLEHYIGNPLLERKISLLTLGTTAPEFVDLIKPKGPLEALRWPAIFRENISPSQRHYQSRRRMSLTTLPSVADTQRRNSQSGGSRKRGKSLRRNSDVVSKRSLTPSEQTASHSSVRLPSPFLASEPDAFLTPPQSPIENVGDKSIIKNAKPSTEKPNTKPQSYFPMPDIAHLQVHRPPKNTHPMIARWQPVYLLNGNRVDHPWKQSSLPDSTLMQYTTGGHCHELVHFGHCSKGLKCGCRHENISADIREGIRWHMLKIPCSKGVKCRRRNCVRGHLPPATS